MIRGNASRLENFFIAGFATVIIVAYRWALVGELGNETPFWDQWDAEAWGLYRPWLLGTLELKDLLAAHNEHRIFTTRIWSLALFELNGREWSPLLQMKANAIVYGVICFCLLYYLSEQQDRVFRFSAAVAIVLFSCAPFSWENILAGFQSQFYFLLLFSFAAILSVTRSSTPASYLTATAFSALAYLSGAGGLLTPLAVTGVILYRGYSLGNLPGKDRWAVLHFASIAFLFYWLTPHVAGHDSLRADGVANLLVAFRYSVSWPVVFLGGAWFASFPLLCFFIYRLREDRAAKTVDHRALLQIALGGWVLIQLFTLSYSRAEGVLASRYMDIYAIGLVLNLLMALHIIRLSSAKALLRASSVLAILWGLLLFASLPMAIGQSWQAAVHRSQITSIQQQRVMAYICNGDVAAILTAPHMHIPYPSGPALKSFVDDETVRKFLPPQLKLCAN